jgi:hypothetical protein
VPPRPASTQATESIRARTELRWAPQSSRLALCASNKYWPSEGLPRPHMAGHASAGHERPRYRRYGHHPEPGGAPHGAPRTRLDESDPGPLGARVAPLGSEGSVVPARRTTK